MNFTFRGKPLIIRRQAYAAGQICLQAYTTDGEPWLTATVCVPGVKLDADEVIIKDYSENAGVLDALVEAQIVEPPNSFVQVGYAVGLVCKLA
jgi:hypothetical protein